MKKVTIVLLAVLMGLSLSLGGCKTMQKIDKNIKKSLKGSDKRIEKTTKEIKKKVNKK